MSGSDESKNDAREAPVAQLAKDLALLVRSEIESARDEMAEKAKSVGIGAGMLSASAVSALLALGTLTALAIVALSLAVPPWAATLVVTVVWAAIALTFGLIGKKKMASAGSLLPERTIAEVKEDFKWARRDAPPSRK